MRLRHQLKMGKRMNHDVTTSKEHTIVDRPSRHRIFSRRHLLVHQSYVKRFRILKGMVFPFDVRLFDRLRYG